MSSVETPNGKEYAVAIRTDDKGCRHPNLAWDILFCKAFCTDCGARFVERALVDEASPPPTAPQEAVSMLIEFVERNIMPYQPVGDAVEWRQAKEALRVLKAQPSARVARIESPEDVDRRTMLAEGEIKCSRCGETGDSWSGCQDPQCPAEYEQEQHDREALESAQEKLK